MKVIGTKTNRIHFHELKTISVAIFLSAALAFLTACQPTATETSQEQPDPEYTESYGGRQNDPDAELSDRQTRSQKEEQQEVESKQGLPQPEHNLELQDRLQVEEEEPQDQN